MDLKSTYNRIALDWFKDHQEDTWWVEGTDKFVSLLKSDNLVLDVGCGAGVKSEYLIKKGLKVVGIDFSEKMIEIARKRIPDGEFFVMDIMKPIKINEQFDGVFAQAVLLHIPKSDVKKVIANLVKQLEPKGYLYIAVKGVKEGQEEEKIIKENDYGYEYKRFFSFYRLEEIINYTKELGMRNVYNNVASVGKTDWIQVIAQK